MAKTLAIVIGLVFVVVAIMGFMNTPLVGANGTFETNTVHDIVHLVSGVIFLALAFTAANSIPSVFKAFGIVYLLVAVIGFFEGDHVLGLIDTNMADHWLHVVLGVVILALGFITGKKEPTPMQPM